jgi:hypothetical protein
MMGYSVAFLLEEKNSISADTDFILRDPYSKDIVIKVPVSVPYQTSWQSPEPAEGRIEHEGEFYQMVTKQLINDTLYVHCSFDQSARDQFLNLVSKINDQVAGDHDDGQKQNPSSILKSFLKEYMSNDRRHTFYVFEWSDNQFNYSLAQRFALESTLSISSPPPD